jgi:hypothetical protein
MAENVRNVKKLQLGVLLMALRSFKKMKVPGVNNIYIIHRTYIKGNLGSFCS